MPKPVPTFVVIALATAIIGAKFCEENEELFVSEKEKPLMDVLQGEKQN